MVRRLRHFLDTALRGGLIGIASALGAAPPSKLAEMRRPSFLAAITAVQAPQVRAPASWRAKKGMIRELPGLVVLFEDETHNAVVRRDSEAE